MTLGLTLEKTAQSRQARSVLKRAVDRDLQESPGAEGRRRQKNFVSWSEMLTGR